MKRLTLSSILLIPALFNCSSVEYDSTQKVERETVEHYIASSRKELATLTINDSDRCISGQLKIAYRLLDKTEQEYAGHMYDDAFITLTKFDRQIRKLQCIQSYVEGKFGCQETNKFSVLKDWYKSGSFEQCSDNLQSDESTIKSEAVDLTSHNIITETLHDFDQAKIKPIYFPMLDNLVKLMQHFPASSLRVLGHADSFGAAQYNDELSWERAKNVAEYFFERGIPFENITLVSNGELMLRNIETSSQQRVFNRFTQLSLNLVIEMPSPIRGGDYE
ncbi:OmpA family protein [Thalassotalea sp. M1531]|uniref:OmpA family protein n=1 Tax=Thalassotalea algicola TaxID=2716224 RepID=A0A7Y0LDC5_9GAMM|nr:OmpA family protein [Thalassotalea algicola]NMP32099.1 OmpA family protein [Thalassotalea algicola]